MIRRQPDIDSKAGFELLAATVFARDTDPRVGTQYQPEPADSWTTGVRERFADNWNH